MAKKYTTWEDHPEWNKLEQICNQIEHLKLKAERLRSKIQKEVFGDN